MKKHISQLGLLSLVLLILTAGLFYEVLNPWFNPIFPFIILYFFIFNLVQHSALLKKKEKSPMAFNTSFMAWFSIKLFLNLTIVIAFVFLNRSEALSFILYFASCYIFYTVFEVTSLVKSLKSK
ncbi:hypothetical protein EO244_08080 [Ancylomarina salipaludis]|uniref:Uncharacterized protein n=1 Tax=Ancylomarina salipaludis TaxID=2501299 RepID=A0A4Q1JLM9_9BACT|nr:hypothetical protein [Ancylomarina salipaludis]RXQ95000.1 hypothetical protein EO244_08080 [Ancylomarina salipaludis]